MLESYFPVFVFILVGIAFGFAPVLTGLIVAPHRPDSEKLSPYECGFEAFEDARMKFDVDVYKRQGDTLREMSFPCRSAR